MLASAQQLQEALGLPTVPDHSTLWWCSRHKVKPRLLERLLTETVRMFERAATPRAHGGRRFYGLCACSNAPVLPAAGRHTLPGPDLAEVVRGRVYEPLVLCGQVADRGPSGDHVAFHPLVAEALVRWPFTRLLADGSYDSEANHRWWRAELGIERLIPPGTGRPSQGVTMRPYCRQLQLAFPRKAYGQRWKVETFISVVKRRFGGAVTARRYWQQVKQTLLRGVTYNLYRAVQLGLSVQRRSPRLVKAAA